MKSQRLLRERQHVSKHYGVAILWTAVGLALGTLQGDIEEYAREAGEGDSTFCKFSNAKGVPMEEIIRNKTS
jgi:hypothetical protein